ncbi:MAG: RuBisCO large subunit C-terminal-like domain-containing protein [Thermoprotei archaeon]
MSSYKIDYEDLLDVLFETIDLGNYVIAIYMIGIPSGFNPDIVARALAAEQTTGTWIRTPMETPEMRKKIGGKVVGIYEIPDHETEIPKDTLRWFIVAIAFPWINFESDISMIFSSITGNIMAYGKIKLLDIWMPREYLKLYKGPKYGIEGLRSLTKIYDRPFIVAMIKPCVYYPPDIGAKLAYEAWVGGVDIIKDDELLANQSYNRVEDRIVKFMEALDKAEAETGEKKLYTVNITSDPPKLFELAEKAQELGANALMVNCVSVGLGAFKSLAEDPSIKLPILVHSIDFTGTMYTSPYGGITSTLIIGKLTRLAGADMNIYPAPYGKVPTYTREKYIRVAKYLRAPMAHIKPTLPCPSGGITQLHVPQLIKDLGIDVGISAGGAIHAHPMGPRAGAKAMRQAIEATLKNIPLEEYAKEKPELKAAIEAYKKGSLAIMLGL